MGSGARDLDAWLEPFLAALGHKKRRIWAPFGVDPLSWSPAGFRERCTHAQDTPAVLA